MRVAWHKVRHDLTSSPARTAQVVAIVAVGVSVLGALLGARTLVTSTMAQIWQDSEPAAIFLRTDAPVPAELLTTIDSLDGVRGVDAYLSQAVQWRTEDSERWRQAALISREPHERQRFTQMAALEGAWPSGSTISLGQGMDAVYGLAPGDDVTVRLGDEDHSFTVGGVVYDPIARPPSFGGDGRIFMTPERAMELTGSTGPNRLLIALDEFEPSSAAGVADEVQVLLEAQGIDSRGFLPPFSSRVHDPERHFFQDIINGSLLLLAVFSFLALLLGLLLVYNTIEATVSRQVDQIGVMKALGASSRQVRRLYSTFVLSFGVVAALIAVPVGAIGAWIIHVLLMNSYNADPGPFRVDPLVIALQVAVALLAPLLAALGPLRRAAKITVREALGGYGLHAPPGGRLERALSRLGRLPRLVVLAIGNAFRYRRRALLTQLTLVFSGVIFMVVFSVRESAIYTFEKVVRDNSRYDVYLTLTESHAIAELEPLTEELPGVLEAEVWYRSPAGLKRVAAGEGASEDSGSGSVAGELAVALFGLPESSSLYDAKIRAGRWLQPGDERVVVLNEQVAARAGLGVGDHVTLDRGAGTDGSDDTGTWEVVGVISDPYFVTAVYLPRASALSTVGEAGSGRQLYLQLEEGLDDSAAEREIRQALEAEGFAVLPSGGTLSDLISSALSTLTILILLLGALAVVICVVGGVALSGVTSLNVLDQRRELGVMRALGASARAIRTLLAGEALTLSLTSWLVAIPLAIPLGALLVNLLGGTIQVELIYHYTPLGALLWLVLLVILALVATAVPARQALRTPVREVLSYE